jgi:hypothetical protein
MVYDSICDMRLVRQVSQFLEKKILKIITLISLSFIYFTGIGLTSILGKIIGKKFLLTNPNSSWKKSNYQTNVRKMF